MSKSIYMAVYRLGAIKEENYIMTAGEIEATFEVTPPSKYRWTDIPVTQQRILSVKEIGNVDEVKELYKGRYNQSEGKDLNRWYYEDIEPSREVLNELKDIGFNLYDVFPFGIDTKTPNRDFDKTPLRQLASDIFNEVAPDYEQGNYGKENKEQWVDTLTNHLIVNPALLRNHVHNEDNIAKLEGVINNHVNTLPQSVAAYEKAGVFGEQKVQEIKEAFEQGATPEEAAALIRTGDSQQKKARATKASPENKNQEEPETRLPQSRKSSTFMKWKEKTPEQKAEEYRTIKENVRITDLAEEYGFNLKRAGSYMTLQEHDSVMIKPDKNWFFRNSNEHSGSCIDFALEFGPYAEKKDVMKDFARRAGIEEGKEYIPQTKPKSKEISHEKEEKVELILPKRAPNTKNVFAYLVSHRHIHKSIVSEFIQDHRLYQDERRNCVFAAYDENRKPIFACLRGTNTFVEKPFRGDVKGSDYERCIYIDNGADKLIVNEAIIDSMSVMTFKRHDNFSDKGYNYLALSSANKYKAVMTHLKEHPEIKEVYGAFDNDKAGVLFDNKTQSMLQEEGWKGTYKPMFPTFEKDWNAELVYCEEKGIRYDYYKPKKIEEDVLKEYCQAKYECYEFGHDPRKYTKARNERDNILEKIKETDIPEGVLKYVDGFYDNTDVLNRYPHDTKGSVEAIVEHYNTKDMNFNNYEKNMEVKQNNVLTQQLAKAAHGMERGQVAEVGRG